MSGASELSCVSDPDAVWPRDAVIMAPGRGQPGATLYRFPRYLLRRGFLPCTLHRDKLAACGAVVAVVQAPQLAAAGRRRPSYERRAPRRVRQLASFTAPRRVPAPPPVSAVR